MQFSSELHFLSKFTHKVSISKEARIGKNEQMKNSIIGQ
jgi:hypothetical protein